MSYAHIYAVKHFGTMFATSCDRLSKEKKTLEKMLFITNFEQLNCVLRKV